MKIYYVFSQFPVETQTFAGSDIAELISIGHVVVIRSLKQRPRRASDLVQQWGVEGADISWGNIRTIASNLSPILKNIDCVLYVAWRCCILGWRSPKDLLVSLMCIPRATQIALEARDSSADIVHCFWGRHPSLVLVALAYLKASPLRSLFVGAYDLVLEGFLVELGLKSAQVVYTHSHANEGFFARHGRSDVNVIHRGIPLELDVRPRPERNDFHLITASALNSDKNVSAVIEAFGRAHRKRPQLTLTVCGDGPDASQLKELAAELGLSESVRFTGHIARHELFRLMATAAIFVFLSKKPSERLPNVLKEAMFAGCAIITSHSEGIEELIPSSAHGTVVDAAVPQEVDAAIEAALDEPLHQQNSRKLLNEAHIREVMSTKSSMRKYVEVWNRYLDNATV